MHSPLQVHKISKLVVLVLASATFVACSGEDGLDGPAVLIDERDATAEECEYGGTTIVSGFDTDGTGELADDQVEHSYSVCHGAPGADGDDGDDGKLPPYLFETFEEPPGDNCTFGGQRLAYGTDDDQSGSLSEDQIEEEYFLCHKTCTGSMDLEVDFSIPSSVYLDYEHTVAVDTNADDLAIAVYNADVLSGTTPQDVALLSLDYDADSQELSYGATQDFDDGEEFVLVITDGCYTTVETIEFETIQEGEATVYFVNTTGDELHLADDSDTIDTADDLSTTGPLVFDWGASYSFDILDDDDNIIGSTGSLSFDKPWTTKTIYAYEGGDTPSVNVIEADHFDVSSDQARYRVANHTDSALDVATISDGATTIEYTELSSGDISETIERDADLDMYVGFDTSGDGEADVDYTSLVGHFDDGSVIDAIAIEVDDVIYLFTVNYSTEDTAFYDPRVEEYTSTPQVDIPIDGQESDTIAVVDCDTVENITMDIVFYNTWRGEFSVYLENPAGEEYALKSQPGSGMFGDSNDNIIGNFNETLDPLCGNNCTVDVEPISIFEDSAGNGDWTVTIVDKSDYDEDAHLDSWGLNLMCD